MTRTRYLALLALSLLAAAMFPFSSSPVHAAPNPLLVVVGANVPVADISTADLRRAFQGLPTEYQSGKRFIPINHPTGADTRVQFDKVVLGLTPDAVGAFWIDRRIRDESPPPRTVPSADLALRIAGSLPGAITYISADNLNPTVKALTIDGKAAGSAGYLLR